MRRRLVRLPPIDALPVASRDDEDHPLSASQTLPTLAELRNEMRRLAWRHGSFTITPYGYLWGNTVYATQRTTNGTYTLFVDSSDESREGEFIVDARNSRLGLNVGGPKLKLCGGIDSGGRVETDFQNIVLTTENRATLVLRHAYVELKNDEWRLLAGQTWDVISPLLPGVWNAGACWDAGNVGYRRAQIRGERYLKCSNDALTTAQLSLNTQIFEDNSSTCCGEPSDWPIVEGRIAWTFAGRNDSTRKTTVGLSGHIGEEQFDHSIVGRNIKRRTWSGNLDLFFPLTDRLGMQGELYVGENLGAFMGNIGQGMNIQSLAAIRGAGGWFDVWFDWTPDLHSHFGYSLDDPVDSDLASGQRRYNQCYFGNLEWYLTKTFVVACEVSSWRTLYVDRLPGDAVRIECVARYGF